MKTEPRGVTVGGANCVRWNSQGLVRFSNLLAALHPKIKNVKSRANDMAPVPYDGRGWCETDFSIPSEVKVGKQIGTVRGVK